MNSLTEVEIKNLIRISKNIFAKMQDCISKYIFEQRLLYSFTGNNEFIQNVIMTTDEGKRLKQLLESTEQNYIFGAGTWETGLAKVWNGHFDGFIDNNSKKWGALQIQG